jgi:hypothetical protein
MGKWGQQDASKMQLAVGRQAASGARIDAAPRNAIINGIGKKRCRLLTPP